MKISCRLFFPIEIVMTLFIYDKTLDGLLTAVFDAYYRKTFPDVLLTDGEALPLFYDEVFTVITDDEKAGRVWRGLQKKYRRLHFRPLPGVGCRNCPRWVYSCSGTSVKPLIPLYPLKRILVIRMYLPFPGYGNEWIGSGCVCCSSYAFRKQRMALSLLLLNLSTTHYH